MVDANIPDIALEPDKTVKKVSTIIIPNTQTTCAWPQGYKTFFMLNSAEHEIFHANKSQITNSAKFFLA